MLEEGQDKFQKWMSNKQIVVLFIPGDKVRFNSKIGKDEGFIVGIHFGDGNVYYDVIWSDKTIKSHWGFELEKF